MTGVRVRGLRKSFQTVRRRQEVLKGIDLELAPGEVVGLIGPNGAGKTTLMSCLLGFLQPDAGDISIDDRRNDDLEVRRITGFVPERMNFDRRATGLAFLRYMSRLAGVESDDRVYAMLERLGIAGAAQKRLSQYSRGMLQRIGMAQALIHQPSYLFLDEPTSGLDPNGVLLVRDLIMEQKQRGATVLLNSHQLAEVGKVCDRVFFLSGGIIAREEMLRQVDSIAVAITLLPGFDADRLSAYGAIRNDVLLATVENETAIAQLVRTIVACGAGVIDVRRHTADLESIFRGEP